MKQIEEYWGRIEQWLAEYAGDILKTLRTPALGKDVAKLEQRIGWPIPDDYRRSLVRHDGTSPDCGLLAGRELLCVRQALEVVTYNYGNAPPSPSMMLPIASDPLESGALFIGLCSKGQVMASWRVSSKPMVLAGSFADWLSRIADDMQSGHVSLDGSFLRYSPQATFLWPAETDG